VCHVLGHFDRLPNLGPREQMTIELECRATQSCWRKYVRNKDAEAFGNLSPTPHGVLADRRQAIDVEEDHRNRQTVAPGAVDFFASTASRTRAYSGQAVDHRGACGLSQGAGGWRACRTTPAVRVARRLATAHLWRRWFR
jgi:hypothetical protein